MTKRKPIEIVDLQLSNDGTYSEKKVKRNVPVVRTKQREKLKDNSDTFLGGIDLGLGLIEKIVPRVERFLKLRG